MGGPVGPQAQIAVLGPKACFREELERVGAQHLINRCGSPLASEVGLNSHHHAVVQGPLVPVGGTNRD